MVLGQCARGRQHVQGGRGLIIHVKKIQRSVWDLSKIHGKSELNVLYRCINDFSSIAETSYQDTHIWDSTTLHDQSQ